MTQYGFYFDSSRCTGCHTCEIACKDYHDLTQLETFRRVYDCEGGTTQGASDDTAASTAFAYHVSAASNHCANPGCIAATGNDGTIVKDDETGLVLIVDAAGVADPVKVTRSALQNAASIAGLFLTTEAVVANKPEPKAAAPAAGADMGY